MPLFYTILSNHSQNIYLLSPLASLYLHPHLFVLLPIYAARQIMLYLQQLQDTSWSICSRCSTLGRSTKNLRGILLHAIVIKGHAIITNLLIASSISFGLLVAPIIMMLFCSDVSSPSHKLDLGKSWKVFVLYLRKRALTLPDASFSIELLVLKKLVTQGTIQWGYLRKESISSINIIQGCSFLARLNTAADNCSDSPNHLLIIVDQFRYAVCQSELHAHHRVATHLCTNDTNKEDITFFCCRFC